MTAEKSLPAPLSPDAQTECAAEAPDLLQDRLLNCKAMSLLPGPLIQAEFAKHKGRSREIFFGSPPTSDHLQTGWELLWSSKCEFQGLAYWEVWMVKDDFP